MMRRFLALALATCLPFFGGTAARADNGRPTDRQIEQYLIDVPTSQGILDDLTRLNAEAHYAGSAGDRDMAAWMSDKLRSYGFTTRIEPVYAQVPQLKRAVLQLMERPAIDFDVKEVPIPQDPDGSRPDAGVPFNAWSGSGDVTAPLVYANRGLDADYQTLATAGVPVQGRIVLIRYGAEFRGDLARRAAAHGAAGVLFYDDPAARDGSSHGAPYPDGPYRPLGSVQRGSLGSPAIAIPALPITAVVAQRLLQEIAGAAPPKDWRGGLGADYALGSSRVPVRLRVDESYSWVYLWNTIGVLPGLDTSRSVIFGGHRDAWVYGVTDNGAGISTLLEAAHALGYVYRAGWRPQYSIVIAGWDGEEVGEVGSTAYVHAHSLELRQGCVAYVNADENVTGDFLYSSGVAGLAQVLPPLTRLVPDPHDRTRTLWQEWHAQPDGVRTQAPGGGSDHEPFLYLLGIPVLDFGFYGPFGVYHSAFDDLRYARTQADPNFVYHRAASQLLALLAFQMTSAPQLPYDAAAYVAPMRDAYSRLAAANSVGADLTPVSRAIDRFAAAAAQSGAAGLQGERGMEAIRSIDLLFYGRSGYAGTIFPNL
ncbi:MAG TPA: M28 family peptidase, partial [Candidatus Acidoferrales bacterium]|nr:M28 family peptidase [Candidatus Acidoferrales bacterium]